MVEASVAESVRRYLSTLQASGLPIRFGVVFGSQVTGGVHEWSDIDVLVVSPRFDQVRDRREWGDLWATASRIDSRIEPIPCGETEWREDDERAIVEIARREGEIVFPSGEG